MNALSLRDASRRRRRRAALFTCAVLYCTYFEVLAGMSWDEM